MTKRTRNGRKRSCKTSCLACTFFSIWKLLFDKTRKKKKKKIVAIRESFFQMEFFLIFAKVFYAKFVPKITIRESFCQKFRDFLVSWKFLPLKYTAASFFQVHKIRNIQKYIILRKLNWFEIHEHRSTDFEQKQPPEMFYVLCKRCSEKFHKIHRKQCGGKAQNKLHLFKKDAVTRNEKIRFSKNYCLVHVVNNCIFGK